MAWNDSWKTDIDNKRLIVKDDKRFCETTSFHTTKMFNKQGVEFQQPTIMGWRCALYPEKYRLSSNAIKFCKYYIYLVSSQPIHFTLHFLITTFTCSTVSTFMAHR